MSKPFLTVDCSADSPDFRLAVLEPGIPVLDPPGANAKTLYGWLGRFAGYAEREGELLRFYLQSEESGLRRYVRCRPCTARQLERELKGEMEELRKRVEQVAPRSTREQTLYQSLRALLDRLGSESNRGEVGYHFFHYRDEQGKRRVVLCLGFQRAKQDKLSPAVCPGDECARLFPFRPRKTVRCPQCGRVLRFRWKQFLAAAAVLLLLAAGGWFVWSLPLGRIGGRVVDSTASPQRPVANADVRLVGTDHRVQTDEEGRFSFRWLDAGPKKVQVSAPGFREELLDVELKRREARELDVALKGDAEVAVEVRFDNFNDPVPIVGAEVALRGTRFAGRTDKQGLVRFSDCRSGKALIEVSAPGYGPEQVEQNLAAGNRTDVDVSLRGDAIVCGTITTHGTGQGIGGCEVSVAETNGTARTEPDGSYRLEGVPSGDRRLAVSREGFVGQDVEVHLKSGESTTVDLALRGDTVLTGRVVDIANNQPIAGSRVALKDSKEHQTTTDEQGNFRLTQMPTGKVTVEALADGFLPRTVSTTLIAEQENAVGDVALTGGVFLQGHVIDGVTKLPVASATVRVVDPPSSPTLTGDEGEFRILGVSESEGELKVEADGYGPQTVAFDPQHLVDIAVELLGAGSVTGRVLNGATGKPLEGAQVAVSGTSLTATTDDQGRFRLERLRCAPTELKAAAPGFAPKTDTVEVTDQETPPVEIVLGGAATLAGTLVDGNRDPAAPIPGATIRIADTTLSAQSGADGSYSLSGVPAGAASVQVVADGYRPEQKSMELGDGSNRLDFSLTGGEGVGGTVVYLGDGEPVPVEGATVSVRGTTLSARTDAQGRFSLEGISPGPAVLIGSAEGFQEARVDCDVRSDSEIRIGLHGDASVRGRVLSAATGQPLPGADVRVVGSPIRTKTDAGGQFEASEVRSGNTTVGVSHAGYASQQVPAELTAAQTTSLEDVLLAGDATLVGRVEERAAPQRPVPGAAIRIADTRLSSTSGADGTYRIAGVPSGPVRVDFSAKGFVEERKVAERLPAGETRLDVPLSRATKLAVAVVDKANPQQPVAGAKVSIPDTDYSGTTDQGGRVVFDMIPAGETRLDVSAPGFCDETLTKTLEPGQSQVAVPLSREAHLAMKVVDAISHQPIADAVVHVAGVAQDARREADGRYHLRGLRPGKATLGVSAGNGYQPVQGEQELRAGENALEVALTGKCEFSGTVTSALDGRPIGGAKVQLSLGEIRRETNTSSNGSFRLQQLPPGLAGVKVSAAGYRSRELSPSLEPGAAPTSIKLSPETTLTVTVVDPSGRSVPGARVSVSGGGGAKTTTARGQAVFDGIPAGRLTVKVESPNRELCGKSVTVAANPGASAVRVALGRGGTLKGEVVNAVNNEPIAGAAVRVEVGDDVRTGWADTSGRYTIEEIPVGQAKVSVSSPGFVEETVPLAIGAGANSLRTVLSPDIRPGELRIVLTWGANPRDLDCHLYGPGSHVYYASRQTEDATLDVDDKDGFGPETVTITNPGAGRYEYWVQDATNAHDSRSRALSTAGALVRVFRHGARPTAISIKGAGGTGPVWHGFNFSVDAAGRFQVSPAASFHGNLPER